MRSSTLFTLPTLALLLAGLPLCSAQMEDHHHDDAPAANEKLGEVHFAITCRPASQAPFERGIALLHSFGYTEAESQFRSLTAADPACAMAHWGVAMSQFHELWGRPELKEAAVGASEMKIASELAQHSPNPSPRELAYIHALNAFYIAVPQGFQKAADGYVADMATLHAAYPEDVEGSAFYALALLASVPPTDTSLSRERQALAVLLPLFAAHPEHPGLAHYIIHTCDTPALAAQGLDAARVYARIAPSSAHALHMPGHIFARLGMWHEDINSNLASVAASEKDEGEHQPGAAHQLHADQFLIYAWLQVGEDAKARDLTARIRGIGERMSAMPGMDDMKDSGHFFDNQLRVIYPMEMRDWKSLASVEPAPGSKPMEKFDSFWGQGVAAGHLHDAKLAAAALKGFDISLDALKKSPYADSADNALVQRNEIVAWQAYIQNRPDEAVAAMRRAADQQDKLGQGEVDIPAREMLGDLLMMLHRPQDALTEYKVALTLSPNRLNGLLSAGNAAESAGLASEAATYDAQAAHNTAGGKDTHRPEVLHAVQFSAAHPVVASR